MSGRRLMVATRVSLSIGLAGVTISLFLGVLFGGISGLYGGIVDTVDPAPDRDRALDPDHPAVDGLAAALPNTWSSLQVYFAITVIISLIGWTDLARVVRGRFLSLREEDFRGRRRARWAPARCASSFATCCPRS